MYESRGNQNRALEYYLKCLKIYEAVLGDKHVNTATSYNKIGSIYESKGNKNTALEYYQKSLKIREAVLREYHVETATSYNNIG